MLAVMESVAVFEEHRSLLLGVAYRMLGSMWDAEDVVQDAYARWARTGQDVENPRAFLLTVVTRIALDHLKSARVARESYVGPWLPEPVATGSLGPLDTAELRDGLTAAGLDVRLAPALAVEAAEHAERWQVEDRNRATLAELGLPTTELPFLPGPVDLGGLYELAELLRPAEAAA